MREHRRPEAEKRKATPIKNPLRPFGRKKAERKNIVQIYLRTMFFCRQNAGTSKRAQFLRFDILIKRTELEGG